ncbi:MAG: ABC transporter ATP-binding protein, partial [Deltaproteobacteria bacterium]|nr:ABC transporter ATP-binding protein [Deltaproteobacteria bacterium]
MKVSPILAVTNLVISTLIDSKNVNLVDNLSFELFPSEILSIVGESGSGKSITAKSILGLLPKNFSVSGEIKYHETNLIQPDEKVMLGVRGHEIGLVFQEPMTALNPVLSIGEQLTESMIISGKVNSKIAHELALEMLNRVGITHPKERMEQFPH